MNLHGIVAGAIGAVNPSLLGTVQVSTGYTQDAAGNQIPTYATTINVPMQVQALTFRDLKQIDGLNLTGTRRAIYLNGKLDGVVRVSAKGGDLITIPSGASAGVWLTALVLEAWADWTKVAATLQDGA